MVMENKQGICPRIDQEVGWELHYEKAEDGTVEYKDCQCSELICCPQFSEEECPWIWIRYFDSQLGTQIAQEWEEYYANNPEDAEPIEGEEAPPEE